jgi:hypothetical protein
MFGCIVSGKYRAKGFKVKGIGYTVLLQQLSYCIINFTEIEML